MLMQNFKSAADLGITEPQLSALQKTLVLLETGKLAYVDSNATTKCIDPEPAFSGQFNMACWASAHPCGSICCIGGTAELIGNLSFGDWSNSGNQSLITLFAPDNTSWDGITPAQAATALRSYLTTGDARWDLAVA